MSKSVSHLLAEMANAPSATNFIFHFILDYGWGKSLLRG